MNELGVAVKITKKNHAETMRLWNKSVKLIKLEIPFNDEYGFSDLKIVVDCGYCKQFKNIESEEWCMDCHLYKIGICYAVQADGGETKFWQLIVEMRKTLNKSEILDFKQSEKVDWDKAYKLVTEIRDAIKKDKPE